jgi:hypothetical protein
MKRAPIRDLRQGSNKINRPLHKAEEPETPTSCRVIAVPDFLARLRSIYGEKVLAVTGAELISSDRG